MNAAATRQGRFWRSTSLVVIAGFVLLTFCARWSVIEAQPGGQKKRNNPPMTPARAAKEDAPKAKLDSAHSLTAGKPVDARALAKVIDQDLLRRLQSEKLTAGPLADDAEFLRRVYLDLIGIIPPADKVKAFLDSTDANKRAKVIDELLDNPRFGTFLAERWAELMVPRDSNNRALDTEPLKTWLTEAFNKNQPLNKLVYDLITATGTQEANGAVTYFIANNTADKITDNVTRMFLGVQLQCAQCHNHPFTDYKQNEYWAMAAFFMKTRASATPQQAAKSGTPIEVSENPKALPKKKGLPEAAKIVPAKFLRGEQPTLSPRDPARPVLAHWMTSDSNPYFARAMANRFWYQLFGRGMVNPVDDMHADNAPVLPEILATLAEQLRLNHYDAKYLVRALCNTDAYQRTSRNGDKDSPPDADLYRIRPVRVLSAEQLYDSVTQILGQPATKKGAMADKGVAKKKGGGSPRQQFVNFFHIDDANPLEYQIGIPQALRLMNSVQMNRTEPVVASAMRGGKGPEQVVEQLYLMTVSRRPLPDEQKRLETYISKQVTPQRAYGDILWALLNSSEFVTNH